jgi:diaminobutyrate-2-oxoglutarate transaminase
MHHSQEKPNVSVFERFESNVRSYCRHFPDVFSRAQGTELFTRNGRRYLDFLSGAGTLNYGHNNKLLLEPVISYLSEGGVLHSLDLHTVAKEQFIESFQTVILQPRKMSYKLQFTGPTGTNAVEAALKLARKYTGRTNVIAFSNGFHGMSQGALAATANLSKRGGAGMMLSGVTHLPYDGFLGPGIDTMDVIEGMTRGCGSGLAPPAAFIVETVQGEGGLNVAGGAWIRRLERLANELGALLIVDDIQAGVGRAGSFFSFEDLGISPDIVVLSKSLSGIGTPFSVVLLRPDLDIWEPGEHNGTFRGNNLAFVSASAAIRNYWSDKAFNNEVAARAKYLADGLADVVRKAPDGDVRVKGKSLFVGLEFSKPSMATSLSAAMYDRGVIVETCGHQDQVLKFLPPLTVSEDELGEALTALKRSIESAVVRN